MFRRVTTIVKEFETNRLLEEGMALNVSENGFHVEEGGIEKNILSLSSMF